MAGPSGDWHRADQRHLRLCQEQVWGECPDTPDWTAVPVLGERIGPKAARPYYRPETSFGGFVRTVHLPGAQHVAGSVAMRLWPQVTGLLLEMALDREDGELRSYCADVYTPADPRRCLGLKAGSLELAMSGRGGDAILRLDLRGRSEEPNAELEEDDFDYSMISPVPFGFGGAQVVLGGSPVTDVEELVVRVDNGLWAGPDRGGLAAFLAAGPRAVTVEMTKLADGQAFNAALRSGGTFSLSVTLTHPQGHVLTLELPVLYPEAADERAASGQLASSAVRMAAGADEEGNDLAYTLELNP